MLIAEHPPLFEKFCRDQLVYILGLINSIPATNKDIRLRNGFVPISSAILQRIIPSYKKYLDYLIEHGILLTDNWYLKRDKSKGYKFTRKYSSELLNEVLISSAALKKRIERNRKIGLKQRTKYKHLLKWYTSELSIDWQAAIEFIKNDYRVKKKDHKLWVSSSSPDYKDPLRQYYSSQVSIKKIQAGDFSISIDDNVRRLHSTLSNMRGDLRKFLTFAYRGLASVDISNSQPYLSLLLLNSSFWSNREGLHLLTIVNSYKEVFNNTSILSSFVMLCKKAESRTDSDVHRFKELVLNGEFYTYMASKLGIDVNERKQIKSIVFQVLFTDNRFIGQEEAAPKRVFKQLFPTVYELFSLIKKKDNATLPRLLQRIESHMVLQVITKRISKEKKDLPIFTLHDSVITTIGNEMYVNKVMEEEFEKVMGKAPALKIEHWTKSNDRKIRA